MRAVVMKDFGGPDQLELVERPVPVPSGDEIVVEVAYCGVCRHDLLTREGAFPHVERPRVLGHQVSGLVVDCGPEATFQIGDRVMSMIFMGCGRCAECRDGNPALCQTSRAVFMGDDFDGGYAEFICTPSRAFTAVPAGVDLLKAAVVNCTLGTAYHAVHSRGRVRAGETVLVTGASGGLGLHTMELLRAADATVIAVTSDPQKTEALEALGAHIVIADEDLAFAAPAKQFNGGGVDLVIEVVGSATFNQSIHALRPGGRMVLLGNVNGRDASFAPAKIILKELSIIGTKSCTAAELTEVCRSVAEGEVDVHIDEVVDLEDVAEVHRKMESGEGPARSVLRLTGNS